ncbi:MAG TPA: ABC transporter permease [Anaerolineales bacterium]|nr:ABC transporter permease [Anaerolineales bacterium]
MINRNFWLVFWHDYTTRVFNRRFLGVVFGVPLFILGVSIVSGLLVAFTTDSRPIGIVDESGLLRQARVDENEFVFLSERATAEIALQRRKVQAYYYLPSGFPTSPAELVYPSDVPASSYQRSFASLVHQQQLRQAGVPETVVMRISAGNVIRSQVQPAGQEGTPTFFLPLMVSFLLIMAIVNTSGYALYLVVQEKENRLVEVLLTSIDSRNLFSAKILAVAAMGLTQLLLWVAAGALALGIVLTAYPDFAKWLPSAWVWLKIVALTVPLFVFLCALMAWLGTSVSQASEAQQMMGLIIQPVLVPFYLIALILENPQTVLAQVLSFLPFTAPLTVLIREANSQLTAGQWGLILACQVAYAWLAMTVAGRSFRANILQKAGTPWWKAWRRKVLISES